MRIYDLTLPISGEEENAQIEPDRSFIKNGITMSTLNLHSHSGTHMDAPLHFLLDGKPLDTMPLEKCVGPAIVCDLSHKEPDSFITVKDLEPWADKIGHKSRVLIRTDWSQHHGKLFFQTSFPRIHVECAQWLADRGIWLVGIEHQSVAKLTDMQELTEVHHAFLKSEVVIVEGLANLKDLPQEDVMFSALPLKIMGGDGVPCRAVAWIGE